MEILHLGAPVGTERIFHVEKVLALSAILGIDRLIDSTAIALDLVHGTLMSPRRRSRQLTGAAESA